MYTLKAFENDVLYQVPFLQKIQTQNVLSDFRQRQTIFCGSGDSLAAALLAEAFSSMRVRAADPLDLIKNSSITQNNYLYLVSISGNTTSNVKIAKITKKAIAITSNTRSRLAKACSHSIKLSYPNSGVFTSGSIGFIASAIVCISLVTRFKLEGVSNLFKKAVAISKKIKLAGNVFILGNLHTYPIAMYATAKLYEILGMQSHYERIEQFLHMGLFSVKPGDTVLIFEEKNPHNSKLIYNMKKIGLKVIQPNPGTKNKIAQVLFFTFLAQLVPLFYAKKNHQKECYFVTAKNLRDVSSNMIY